MNKLNLFVESIIFLATFPFHFHADTFAISLSKSHSINTLARRRILVKIQIYRKSHFSRIGDKHGESCISIQCCKCAVVSAVGWFRRVVNVISSLFAGSISILTRIRFFRIYRCDNRLPSSLFALMFRRLASRVKRRQLNCESLAYYRGFSRPRKN